MPTDKTRCSTPHNTRIICFTHKEQHALFNRNTEGNVLYMTNCTTRQGVHLKWETTCHTQDKIMT